MNCSRPEISRKETVRALFQSYEVSCDENEKNADLDDEDLHIKIIVLNQCKTKTAHDNKKNVKREGILEARNCKTKMDKAVKIILK